MKEKQNSALKIAATASLAVGAAAWVLPVARLSTGDATYNPAPWRILLSGINYLGQSIQYPIILKIAALALLLLLLLAGAMVWMKRKRTASWLACSSSALMMVLLFGIGSLEGDLTALGASEFSLTLLPAFFMLLLLPFLAALLILLSRGAETLARTLFLASATVSVASVVIITVYMLISGLPAIIEIGPLNFLFGTIWKPTAADAQFGILPMVLTTIAATIGAIVIGVPVGLLTAAFLAEMAPKRVAGLIRPAVELLAGIPSVIYGFFGLQLVVPLVQKVFNLPSGATLFSAILILAIMILPTIISTAETGLRAVPSYYREASLAVGATRIETIFKVMIPAARSAILSGVILGVGRAIGETMAVIMVAGNVVNLPGLFSSVRPMTVGIALEMSYAMGLHQQALFSIGLILFVFIMIVNLTFNWISSKGVQMDAKK